MRNIDSIIVHCSATKAGQDFTAADIDCWHRERGFNGIGYHYVIRLDGKLEKGVMSLWPVLIVKVGMSRVSGYVISADWMERASGRYPNECSKTGALSDYYGFAAGI